MTLGTPMHSLPMVDSFGRCISYLRLSVTDRCDLRCSYCMEERPKFMPRSELLTPEEIDRLAKAFVDRGVTKIRLTGGEPLVRKDFAEIVDRLGRQIKANRLEELTLTTNGTQLATYADHLVKCGIKRVNVSIDSLIPENYAQITRNGDLEKALEGIAAAKTAGLHCKLNIVLLRDQNANEIPDIIN